MVVKVDIENSGQAGGLAEHARVSLEFEYIAGLEDDDLDEDWKLVRKATGSLYWSNLHDVGLLDAGPIETIRLQSDHLVIRR